MFNPAKVHDLVLRVTYIIAKNSMLPDAAYMYSGAVDSCNRRDGGLHGAVDFGEV
jgi:hypothetical protein